MPNFELYERGSSSRNNRAATVTVQPRGVISLSSASWERLGRPDAVTLLFDQAERLIGFRPSEKALPSAYPVRGPGHVISASSLLRCMKARPDDARRYPLILKDGQPPYIDLKQEGTVVTSNRARTKTRSTS